MMKRLSLLLLIAILVACSPSVAAPAATPTPAGDMVIKPIQIDQVEVSVAESFPVQVYAHIKGLVGDGCTEALPAQQTRQGHTITITIDSQRPKGAICIQIAKIYDETIRLQGEFPSGDYTLKVNDVTQTFHVD